MCRTMLGGFMSERYLGQPEPERTELTTPSLSKYKYAIDQWGGWALFQVCLHVVVIQKIPMLVLLPRFNSSTIIGKPGQQKLFSAVK
jgi:hypothetical protein